MKGGERAERLDAGGEDAAAAALLAIAPRLRRDALDLKLGSWMAGKTRRVMCGSVRFWLYLFQSGSLLTGLLYNSHPCSSGALQHPL